MCIICCVEVQCTTFELGDTTRVECELTQEGYLQAVEQRGIDLGDEILYWCRPAEKPDRRIKGTVSKFPRNK